MSKPTAGNYYIINRLLSPSGEKLAITFNGQGQTTTLTPMASLASQIWTIVDFRDGLNQSVSPLKSPGLQAGPSGGFIASVAPNDLVYRIRLGSNGYAINSGSDGPDNWATSQAINGARVAWGVNQGAKKEWILQPA